MIILDKYSQVSAFVFQPLIYILHMALTLLDSSVFVFLYLQRHRLYESWIKLKYQVFFHYSDPGKIPLQLLG